MEFHLDHELSIISARRERSQHVSVVSHAKTQDHSVLIQIKPSNTQKKLCSSNCLRKSRIYGISALSRQSIIQLTEIPAYPDNRLSLGKVTNSTLNHSLAYYNLRPIILTRIQPLITKHRTRARNQGGATKLATNCTARQTPTLRAS